MALISKGDMPSCCAVCCDCNSADDGNFCNRTGNRLGNDWQLYRPLNCPIIGEIPDKHGKLIDADKVIKSLKKQAMAYWRNNPRYWIVMDVIDSMKNAPTILEATE